MAAGAVEFTVEEAHRIEARTVGLPCNRCGTKGRTVRFYLNHKASTKYVQGFYSDLLVRLCAGCLRAALDALEKPSS
jgi:hypothetical protein